MPKEFTDCVRDVKAKIAAGKMPKSSNAYAICTAQFKKSHGGKTPQEAAGETKAAVRRFAGRGR